MTAVCATLACEKGASSPAPHNVSQDGVVIHGTGTANSNLLENPGFEDGARGWTDFSSTELWGAFQVVDTVARSGRRSLYLPAHATGPEASRRVRVFGGVQELKPNRFPKSISGWYRVERWEKGESPQGLQAPLLYLQVVVVVIGDPRAAQLVEMQDSAQRVNNYQIRYYLAGTGERAYAMPNARVKIVNPSQPKLNEWMYFELPIEDDFKRVWNVTPAGYDVVRVLFEARWDRKPAGTSVFADVYYDDLMVTPSHTPDRATSP